MNTGEPSQTPKSEQTFQIAILALKKFDNKKSTIIGFGTIAKKGEELEKKYTFDFSSNYLLTVKLILQLFHFQQEQVLRLTKYTKSNQCALCTL